MENLTKNIGVKISPLNYAYLVAYCEQRNCTISEVLREAVSARCLEFIVDSLDNIRNPYKGAYYE